jgi:hypothetical protein
LSQIQEVFPQERLSSREEDDRGPKSSQVFDERLSLAGCEFPEIFPVPRMRVAMNAFQVTALPHIPDYHRFLVLGKLEEVGGEPRRMPPVAQRVRGLHGPAVQFRNTDHENLKIIPPEKARRSRRQFSNSMHKIPNKH